MLNTVQHFQQVRPQPAVHAFRVFADAARTVGRAFPMHLLGAGEHSKRDFVASGIPALDALLTGGYPKAGLIELLPSPGVRGEVELLLGAVARLGRTVWVLNPRNPLVPNGAHFAALGIDLTEQLFVIPESAEEAFETAARSAASGEAQAVVAWLPPLSSAEDLRAMRRLSLAAQTAEIPVFAIRPAAMACTNSPAQVRLQLRRTASDHCVRVRANLEGPLCRFVREAVIALDEPRTLNEFSAVRPKDRAAERHCGACAAAAMPGAACAAL